MVVKRESQEAQEENRCSWHRARVVLRGYCSLANYEGGGLGGKSKGQDGTREDISIDPQARPAPFTAVNSNRVHIHSASAIGRLVTGFDPLLEPFCVP